MFEASSDCLHQPYTQATQTPIDFDAFINLDDDFLEPVKTSTDRSSPCTRIILPSYEDATLDNALSRSSARTPSYSPPPQIRTFYEQCCGINNPPKSSVSQRRSNRQGARMKKQMTLKAQVEQLTNLVVSLKDEIVDIRKSVPTMSDGNGPGAMDHTLPTLTPQFAHTVTDGPPTTVTASPVQCPIAKSPGNPPLIIQSFVPGMPKRPRRHYDEIERIYKCGWEGCGKAYGTLRNLNTHITTKSHGSKWKTKKEWSTSQAPSHQPRLHLQKSRKRRWRSSGPLTQTFDQ